MIAQGIHSHLRLGIGRQPQRHLCSRIGDDGIDRALNRRSIDADHGDSRASDEAIRERPGAEQRLVRPHPELRAEFRLIRLRSLPGVAGDDGGVAILVAKGVKDADERKKRIGRGAAVHP